MIVFLQISEVLSRLPTFAASVWEMYQFIPPPSLRFNVAYRDEFVISRFHHCRGGVPIPVMSSLIVSKIACQCIFMPSYPGVPRLLSCIVGVL